jgi:hypothetical protein
MGPGCPNTDWLGHLLERADYRPGTEEPHDDLAGDVPTPQQHGHDRMRPEPTLYWRIFYGEVDQAARDTDSRSTSGSEHELGVFSLMLYSTRPGHCVNCSSIIAKLGLETLDASLQQFS